MNPTLEPDDVRLLTAVGFLAAGRGDVRRAEVIFSALERVRPAGAYCFVGMAMAYLNAGRADDAARVLHRGLSAVEKEDLGHIHAFRGLALQLAGRANASLRALEEAKVGFARAMLGQTEVHMEAI
ncbi:MAG: hypothetical protein ABIR26_16370 [Ramlibacter sp.]